MASWVIRQGERAALLLMVLLLSACASRATLLPDLSASPFRLSSVQLQDSLTQVEARLDPGERGQRRLGLLLGDEQLWYPLEEAERWQRGNVSLVRATLASPQRRRPRNPEQLVAAQGPELLEAVLPVLLDRFTPELDGVAMGWSAGRRSWVSWRQQGEIQLGSLASLPDDVLLFGFVNEQAMTEASYPLMQHWMAQQTPTADVMLVTLNPDKPGDIGWLVLDQARQELIHIITPLEGEQGDRRLSLGVGLKTLDGVLIRSHLVSLLKNPVSSAGRLWNHLEDSALAMVRRAPKVEPDPTAPLYQQPPMDLSDWERRLTGMTLSEPKPGRIELLVGGAAFFPDLLLHLQNAREQILLRTYIFDNDYFAVQVADALRRASETVAVKVLMDDLGSAMAATTPPPGGYPAGFSPPTDIAAYLRRGSQVRARRSGNPWLTGDHVKLTSIDERVAWLGGMNIGSEYRYHWHDLMVRIEGPVVKRLHWEFYRAWAHAGWSGDLGYLLNSLFRDRLVPAYQAEQHEQEWVPLRVLTTTTSKRDIYHTQLAAIAASRSYIYIETPYFTNSRVISELINARARGVDVRVILPGEGNHGVMNSANVITANRLLEGGVRVYVYPGMSHVKAAIYDGWVTTGSANFDRLSLKVNQEMNIASSDPRVAEQFLRQLFLPDLVRSKELTEQIPMTANDHWARVLMVPL